MKFRALFASLLAALLVVGGVTAPAAADDVAVPTITVSKSSDISPAGEIITVTGTGFVPQGSATNGTRPPLAGQFGGVYVAFGKFADTWKPSAAAPSSARKTGSVVWVVSPENVATVTTSPGSAVALGADGSFSVQLLVSRGFAGEPATGNYGIYTYPGSGASYAPFETSAPLAFSTAPTVAVSKTTGISPLGETLTVTGYNFGSVGAASNGTRPPLAGQFGGAYVAFGKFADVWKPSAAAPSSARKTGSVVWAVNPESVATVSTSPSSAVAIAADGTFSVTLPVSRGFTGEPETGNYGIYTYPGSGSTYAAFETFTPIAFTAATPTTTTLTVAPSTGLVEGGSATLSAQVAPIAAGEVTFRSGDTVLGTQAVDAAGLASLAITGLAAGDQAYTADFTPTAALLFAGSSGSATVSVAVKVVGAGSLTWGVKSSFRSYVTGTIAKGSITASGVGTAGGAFTFGQSTGGTFSEATGTGTSYYSGSVRFYGHGGLLDLSLANPVVTVTGPSTAMLSLTVNGSGPVAFATLKLAAGTRSTANNTVAYAGVPATLTAQGAAVFEFNGSSFYPAGTSLDPVSFVIGSASTAGSGTKTLAAFSANSADATPPATTGITLGDGADPSSLVAGGQYTFEAEGFAPAETGVLFVHYSDPVILADDLTADASGRVSWTGTLPAGLTGEHTFTFQGSVDRGIVVTIHPQLQTAALEGCDVTSGDITWGFKESFRSYISGTIANGEWTVADGATYETPSFGFSGATGVYDATTQSGQIDFAGSITFTGHGGVLNTTVANPAIRFDDADTAYLLLDVSGTTQEGQPVSSEAVQFVRLDLSSATVETAGSTITFADAPAELTSDGAAAFGTYETGEAFDPVTVSVTTASECGDLVIPIVADDEPTSSTGAGWLLWLVIALVLLAAVVAAVVIIRRRRAN